PGLECEHRQNCQGGETDSRITQCCPRQRTQNHKGGERNMETTHSSLWCTGKDSNLRTSEEGQIYSLLALTTHPPVQNCRTVRPYLLIRHFSQTSTLRKIFQTDSSKSEEQKSAREYALARKHHTWKIPYGVPLENSVKPPPRRIS